MRSLSFFGLAVSLLILASCTKSDIPTQPGLPPAPDPQASIESIGADLDRNPTYRSCVAQASQICGREVAASIAKTATDESGCDVFEDVWIKQVCQDSVKLELAKRSGDAKSCATLGDPQKIEACTLQVKHFTASKSESPSACKDIYQNASGSIYRESCEIQQVQNLSLPRVTEEFCKALTTSNAQSACRARIQNLPKPPLTLPAQ